MAEELAFKDEAAAEYDRAFGKRQLKHVLSLSR